MTTMLSLDLGLALDRQGEVLFSYVLCVILNRREKFRGARSAGTLAHIFRQPY